ncbi:MAG TPA: GIY-YIG nuclease family protein [Ignavibacteriaceae bacterium]|nr:GIY-YIG nuclease family protein [Ignavibacteriaceae bacterium]
MLINNCYVYILTNKNISVLYTGVTNNLERRIYEHKNKLNEGFTKKFNVNKLVYFELFNDMQSAIIREKQIKIKSRHGKIQLINSINPEWKELIVTFP